MFSRWIDSSPQAPRWQRLGSGIDRPGNRAVTPPARKVERVGETRPSGSVGGASAATVAAKAPPTDFLRGLRLLAADIEVGHMLQTLDQGGVVPTAAAEGRAGAEHLLGVGGVG